MRFGALFLAVPALAVGSGAPTPAAPGVPRAVHTATLLASGDVLVAGGCTVDGCELDELGATTEVFDAESLRFRPGPPLARPRVGHAAVRLADGSVLVFGGWTGNEPTATAERWRPGADRFESSPPLRTRRGGFTVTTLRDGRVLVTGGSDGTRTLRSAELFDPARGSFVASVDARRSRRTHGDPVARRSRARRGWERGG